MIDRVRDKDYDLEEKDEALIIAIQELTHAIRMAVTNGR